MKIGIITFTYGQNFGNKLQNYALLKVLKDLYGDQVFTLQNFDMTTRGTTLTRIKTYIKLLLGLKGERLKFRKQKVFNKFSEENLQYYPIPLTKKNYEKLQDFDVLVCGSDQIWNPQYNKDIDMFTGSFAKTAKKISYAASVGINELPENLEDAWKNAWLKMDSIGVREESTVTLVKNLTGRDAVLQIDPTMLLTKENWIGFEKKPTKNLPKHYVLTYFICNMSIEAKRRVDDFAKKKGFDIIHLNDIFDKEWFDLSPNEFIYLIHHAEFVITDSFHATVFSIVFGKLFHCLQRVNAGHSDKQGARLETLLGYFGLQERYGYDKVFCENTLDYKKINTVLDEIKENSLKSLITMIEE